MHKWAKFKSRAKKGVQCVTEVNGNIVLEVFGMSCRDTLHN